MKVKDIIHKMAMDEVVTDIEMIMIMEEVMEETIKQEELKIINNRLYKKLCGVNYN